MGYAHACASIGDHDLMSFETIGSALLRIPATETEDGAFVLSLSFDMGGTDFPIWSGGREIAFQNAMQMLGPQT